jgi:hypothetical protein
MLETVAFYAGYTKQANVFQDEPSLPHGEWWKALIPVASIPLTSGQAARARTLNDVRDKQSPFKLTHPYIYQLLMGLAGAGAGGVVGGGLEAMRTGSLESPSIIPAAALGANLGLELNALISRLKILNEVKATTKDYKKTKKGAK